MMRQGLLVAVLVAAFVLSLAAGSVSIPLGDVLAALTGNAPAEAPITKIVLQLRLPRALTAALAGAALAVAGLLMQTLFRNPRAGPGVLGISAGASLGVALVVLGAGGEASSWLTGLGLVGEMGLVVAAATGAALVLGGVILAARRVSNVTLLILGLLFGYATGALVTVLLHFSLAERIQAFVVWNFGSFGGVTWGQLRVLAPALVAGLALAFAALKPLNALHLGEAYARSLGIGVTGARLIILTATAILTGAVTAFCGPVAFLGVAVPHLARGLFHTADHRLLLPGTALAGAAVALISDVIAQLPGREAVLPLNAVTALVGAPVIAVLILRRRGLEASFGR